jgi:hypothetical protein
VGDGVGGGVDSTVTCGSKLLIFGALTSPAINNVDITNMKKAFANINTSPASNIDRPWAEAFQINSLPFNYAIIVPILLTWAVLPAIYQEEICHTTR